MIIRVLTFEGCPNCDATRALVEETVRELRVQAGIEVLRVSSEEQARQHGFLGSPSIQIDGIDIEVNRRNDTASFACRIYKTATGLSGVPPKSLLQAAIREAQRIA